MKNSHYSFLLLLFIIIVSCNKEEINYTSHVKLEFSTDTISFDTVFTTIGSTTKRFTVRNPANQSIIISNIQLSGEANKPFRLNINGVNSAQAKNVKLAAKDSLFIFVEATVDPVGQNLPMVVSDSILFQLNGNIQTVKLIAFGQDVHLYNGQHIQTENWVNDKPFLIYNYVVIDSFHTLTIDPGCRIHFHRKSSMFVYGTLKANGTFEEPITFGGDRLEKEYEDIPGQWGYRDTTDDGDLIIYGGIHFFLGSTNNVMNYVKIRNADKGIQVDSMGLSSEPKLTITNSRIENMTLNCIDARTASIEAGNCVFANSGYYTVALYLGGNYNFKHCTFANYFNTTNSLPALLLNNYYEYNNKTYGFDLNANFSNSIIYGEANTQILTSEYPGNKFDYSFQNCLVKIGDESLFPEENFPETIFNMDPIFTKPSDFDFSIDTLSPARNIGDIETAKLFPLDLNNNSRLADEGPDLGALEWLPNN